MSKEFVHVLNPLNYLDIIRRWPRVDASHLGVMIEDGALPAYLPKTTERLITGEPMCFCKVVKSVFEEFQVDEYGTMSGAHDFEHVVFSPEDVERLEAQHPEFKQSLEGAEAEWICCDALAKRWGCNPFDVLGVLGSETGQLQYQLIERARPPRYPDELAGAFVHIYDLHKWETENADNIRKTSLLARGGERLREENQSLADKVAALEHENAVLRGELEGERATIKTVTPRVAKTASATEAAAVKRVEKWKDYAERLVRIALECGHGGPKPRKRNQLQAIAKKHGGELPDVVLEVLRKALPDDHVSREPGPPRQD